MAQDRKEKKQLTPTLFPKRESLHFVTTAAIPRTALFAPKLEDLKTGKQASFVTESSSYFRFVLNIIPSLDSRKEAKTMV